MTTTLAALTTMCKRDFYDSVSATNPFTDLQIADMIGQGINALEQFYPYEVVTSITISAGSYTYATPASISDIFKIVLLDASGVPQGLIHEGSGDLSSGWQEHGGTLFIPRWSDLTTAMTLQVWGYGPWAYIDSSSATSATTNLDTTALWAVRVFVQVAEFEKLVLQRTNFQQWEQTPGDADVSALSLRSIASEKRKQWAEEKLRLRELRKAG